MIEYPEFIIAFAIVCLVVALGLHWLVVHRGNSPHAFQTLVMCWFIMALFPVLILFLFFPSNTAALGSLWQFSLSGTIAAFCVVWWLGIKFTGTATSLDERYERARRAAARKDHRGSAHASGSLQPEPVRLLETKIYRYKVKDHPTAEIACITGALQDVTVADAWVNSENTNMQMSRYFEGTISSIIRYSGAKRDSAGNVIEDTISNELTALMGSHRVVLPATVFVTGSGQLAATNGVRAVFHVAAVEGRVNVGYRQVSNVENCVTAVLAIADAQESASLNVRSVLFPLMGTGRGRADLTQTANCLIRTAANYLASHHKSRIQCVYFLTWTDVELRECLAILDALDRVVPIGDAKRRRTAVA